jgi:hypothetical protein
MKSLRIPSVILALVLQLLPLVRVVQTTVLPVGAPAAIILKWVTAALAVAGTMHAVSGASTMITSPSTASGKVGTTFTYRIKTGPDSANRFAATPLPPGLTLNSLGIISGVPTAAGVTITHLTASDNNRVDRTTTKDLTITITGGASPPTISVPPQTQSILEGSPVTFTVTAGGTAPLTYTWQKDGLPISGATGSSYSISHAASVDQGSYTVTVSNSAGKTTSSAAILTVNIPPSITTQPKNADVISGGTASFVVEAAGTGPLTYQWRRNGILLRGQANPTLTLISITPVEAGSYTATVNSAFGSATSNPAILTVRVPPSITAGPQSTNITEGDSITFAVIADGTSPFTYQWQYNDQDIAGATDSTFTITGAKTNQGGNYRVKVTNSAGEAISNEAVLGVKAKQQPPVVIHAPKLNAGKLEFTFDSVAGMTYQIESSPSVAPFVWTMISTTTASGSSTQFSVAPDQAVSRFYRVRE